MKKNRVDPILSYSNYLTGTSLSLTGFTRYGKTTYSVIKFEKQELKSVDSFENYDKAYSFYGSMLLYLFEVKEKVDHDASISRLYLSARAKNTLRRIGVYKISDLKKMTILDLKRIRGLGKKSISEIVEALKLNGIELKECNV